MPKLTADEVVTQQHKRAFLQWGGPRPNNPVTFAGQDGQYMSITGVSAARGWRVRSDQWARIRPIPNASRASGAWLSAPDLPSATMTFYEKHGYLPRQLFKNCPFTAYEVTGTCHGPVRPV